MTSHQGERALVVVAHPRGASLTAKAADRVHRQLKAAQYEVDLLDLYAEEFDPRLGVADEPDWNDPGKTYSEEVRAHMARIDAADAIAVVFPVWWFAPPAIVKGWIDRVWNHGFAYGGAESRLAAKRMLWLGLAGGSGEAYEANGLTAMMDVQLRMGVSNFCGIADAELRLVHDVENAEAEQVLSGAEVAAAEFLVDRALTGR
ncbi:NAD(P)H oxidoreductase [Saccharopolyspora sp. NPDC050389]|uniref:NAD(P)H oxidoreductase n=1 Tax=Saccharopolyspora sp. NPDC050389 TaxID=3155516 RepID=UPI0033FB7608